VPLAYSPGWDAVEPFGLGLLFVGVVIFVAIGALSHEQERAWSATIIYLAVGIAGAFALDLLGVGALDPTTKTGSLVIERITEVALVVAVFGAGLAVEDAIGWRKWRNVAMLLLVAMPLTIGAVALFGVWAMGLSTGAAIMLGAILAPTDPVLAGDVGLGAPGENTQSSEPRFSLHTEAGMNDGLAAPFIVLGIFVLERGGTGWLGEWILVDVLYALLAAAAVGAICGYGIAAGTVRLRNRHFLDHAFDQYVGLAAGLVAYGASESIGSYGFLAVFVAGFAFRRYEFGHEVNGRSTRGPRATASCSS
jgi:NhaP-type Na+/H+ or K+/H+ antiporter